MKKVAIVLSAVVALAAIFVLLRPKPLTPSAQPETTSHASVSPPVEPSTSADFTITDGAAGGPTTVEATAGQVVTLMLTSDVSGQLHVHGIEVDADVPAGRAVALDVQTDQPGRYSVEFHGDAGAHIEITEIEVSP